MATVYILQGWNEIVKSIFLSELTLTIVLLVEGHHVSTKEIDMADENTIDYPSLCEELSARVAELEAALSEEQDKNAVLVQQVVEAEDTIANREVEAFADVIDAEDKEFFRERLIARGAHPCFIDLVIKAGRMGNCNFGCWNHKIHKKSQNM
jgi:hypothetical protein